MNVSRHGTNKPVQKSGVHQQFLRSIRADYIRKHRKKHFAPDEQAYSKNRGFSEIRGIYNFSMAACLAKQITKAAHRELANSKGNPRPIDIDTPAIRALNVGSGHGLLERDIKATFGNRIHLTSLNVIHPRTTENGRQRAFEKEAMKLGIKEAESRREIRQFTSDNSAKVDEIAVSTAEAFQPKERFHVIIDIASALTHSDNIFQVAEKYYNLLEEKGIIITSSAYNIPLVFYSTGLKKCVLKKHTPRGSRINIYTKVGEL